MADEHQEEWVGLVSRRGYEVSTHGRVRSYWKRGGFRSLADLPQMLKVRQSSRGYLIVNALGGVGLHALICEAFNGPRPAGSQIVCRHLDGNPANNHPDNLCWGTPRENAQDALRLGELNPQRGSRHGMSRLDEDRVREIIRLQSAGQAPEEIGRIFGVSRSTVSKIAKRQTWRHVTA